MKKEERKQRKDRIRRTELLVWLGIFFVTLLLGILIYIHHENSFEYEKIYMPDVDGIIVGSPVHMMGIPIGYVNSVKIINDSEIRVKFKITKRDIHIPAGTFATVEFNGLGGSKSLELYPPSSGKIPNELVGRQDFILVDRPKRLRDSLALLYQMYEKIMDMIYTSANFADNIKQIEKNDIPVGNMSDINHLIDDTNKYIDHYEKSITPVRDVIHKKDRVNNGK